MVVGRQFRRPTIHQMKILSKTAKIIDGQGYVQQSGVTVIEHPASGNQPATVQIGATSHRADDLERIAPDRLRSPAFGWEVQL